MDRDGVVNEEVHLLHKPEDLKLIPKAAEAIALLNQKNIDVILITNQPVIARGMCTEEEVRLIHERLSELLSEHSAHIDAVYYCPHHPKYGDMMKCTCRKPNPGLLHKAQYELGINLSKSFMIGDRTSDIKAGNLAGCTTIGVRTGYACDDGYKDAVPDMMADDLYHAVQIILERWNNDS